MIQLVPIHGPDKSCLRSAGYNPAQKGRDGVKVKNQGDDEAHDARGRDCHKIKQVVFHD
jgi:hypothetical protein